jgi:hypothetical protein
MGKVVEKIHFFGPDSKLQMALVIADVETPRYLSLRGILESVSN